MPTVFILIAVVLLHVVPPSEATTLGEHRTSAQPSREQGLDEPGFQRGAAPWGLECWEMDSSGGRGCGVWGG